MIDKSLSQYYDVPGTKKIKGQLHKLAYITPKEAKALKKMGGKEVITDSGIPAYPPQGRSEQHGGSSRSSSSGGNGSHDRGGQQHQAAAQKAAPAKAPEPDRQDRAREQAAIEQAVREVEEKETAREKAIQVAALTPKKIEPVRSAHVDTPTQIAEQKEIDDWGFEGAKATAPTTLIPKTVTYKRGNPFTIYDQLIPTTVGQTLFDPKTSQNALLDRGSGLGTFAKGVGAALAWPLASAFVPPKLMTGLTWGKRAHDFSKGKGTAAWLAKKAGLDPTKLTSNLNTVDGKYIAGDHHPNTKKRTFDEPRNGDGPKTTAEKITTGKGLEEGQKMLGLNDAQQNYIRKMIAGKDRQELMMISGKAKIRIDSGEASQIEKDVFQMIQEYLV